MTSSLQVQKPSYPTKMLPSIINESYKRYKSDTNSFLNWIYKTAISCGHRRPSQPHEGFFLLNEFDSMVETIVGFSLSIPSHISFIARRAIRLRKRCMEWHQRQIESDLSHLHFVNTLERLLSKLEESNSPLCTVEDDASYLASSPFLSEEYDSFDADIRNFIDEEQNTEWGSPFEDHFDDESVDCFSDDFYFEEDSGGGNNDNDGDDIAEEVESDLNTDLSDQISHNDSGDIVTGYDEEFEDEYSRFSD